MWCLLCVCLSVFDERKRGGIQSEMDGRKHDSTTLNDKKTQPLHWTLMQQLDGPMLNITAHLLQHLKSVPSSVSSEVDRALLISLPAAVLRLFAALSQFTCLT